MRRRDLFPLAFGVPALLHARPLSEQGASVGDVHSGTYGSREGIWPDLMDAQGRISATIMELLTATAKTRQLAA